MDTAESLPARAGMVPAQHETLMLRVGLLAGTVLLWNTATSLWESGDMVRESLSVGLALADYSFSLPLLILSVSRCLPRKATWLLLVVVGLAFASETQVRSVNEKQWGSPQTTDVLLFTNYATSLLRTGENPYAYELTDAYRVYRASTRFRTPTLDGDMTFRMSYPALHMLIYVPFQWLGIATNLIYPLFWLVTLGVLFIGAPPAYRPLVLLPFFADRRFFLYTLGGVSDVGWALLLCAMILSWRRRKLRAFWFGLAISYKQTPWLLAPYLLIRLWHEAGTVSPRQRRALLAEFAALSALVFLVLNVPFILWDFKAWFLSVIEPFHNTMIVLGQGLTSLTLFGYLVIPSPWHMVLMVGLLAASTYLYWRHYSLFPEALWIFPGLIMWFGQRSLTSYWYFFMIPLAFSLVRSTTRPPVHFDPPWISSLSWKVSALVVGGSAALIAGVIVYSAVVFDPKISIEVVGPIGVQNDGNAYQLMAKVTNDSSRTLTPRFSVQSWGDQPNFWVIQQGPLRLEPGTSEVFTLKANLPLETFDPLRGAQVIVSDVSDYGLRASTVLVGSDDAHYPDVFPNADFKYWNVDQQTPRLWGVISEPHAAAAVLYESVEDQRTILRFTLPAVDPHRNWSRVMLDTWVVFPSAPVQVWVNPPSGANRAPDFDLIYGLELLSTSNQHRVWVLFGDENTTGELEPGLFYWMMKTPRGVWSQQTLDLGRIFSDLDVAISPPELMAWRDKEIPLSMLNFRLLLAARDTAVGAPYTAYFGPVSNTASVPDSEALIRDRLEHPDEFLTWRGESSFEARNYDTALDYLDEATARNPDNGRAYFIRGKVLRASGNMQGAIESFEHSITLKYDRAGAVEQLGWVYYEMGDLDKAEEEFRLLISLEESSAQGYDGLGYVYMARNDCNQAAGFFDKALFYQPSLASAQNGRDVCANWMGLPVIGD